MAGYKQPVSETPVPPPVRPRNRTVITSAGPLPVLFLFCYMVSTPSVFTV